VVGAGMSVSFGFWVGSEDEAISDAVVASGARVWDDWLTVGYGKEAGRQVVNFIGQVGDCSSLAVCCP